MGSRRYFLYLRKFYNLGQKVEFVACSIVRMHTKIHSGTHTNIKDVKRMIESLIITYLITVHPLRRKSQH